MCNQHLNECQKKSFCVTGLQTIIKPNFTTSTSIARMLVRIQFIEHWMVWQVRMPWVFWPADS
jgi:hypothetical protein